VLANATGPAFGDEQGLRRTVESVLLSSLCQYSASASATVLSSFRSGSDAGSISESDAPASEWVSG
jgi:hypothetical protein